MLAPHGRDTLPKYQNLTKRDYQTKWEFGFDDTHYVVRHQVMCEPKLAEQGLDKEVGYWTADLSTTDLDTREVEEKHIEGDEALAVARQWNLRWAPGAPV